MMRTVAELLAGGHIEVTGCSLRALVQQAYALSEPRGMGYLHYTPEPLRDEEADAIVAMDFRGLGRAPHVVLALDYVRGRCVKFDVWRARDDAERLFVAPTWFDHTDAQYDALLASVGITR
jgi:hypothetical protein